MLVLSRKKNEAVRAGDVLITVVEVRGNHVRLGIEAPPEVKVLRTELEDRDGPAEQQEEPANA